MNAIELSSSISRFCEQIKPTNNPSDDALVQGLPKWFIEDLEKSATMLRQQTKEIEELRKKLQRLSDIEQEPVLWVHIKTLDRTIRQGTSGAFWHKFPDGYGLSKEEFIPLYTQPLKKAREK